jgi:hypothetical protein
MYDMAKAMEDKKEKITEEVNIFVKLFGGKNGFNGNNNREHSNTIGFCWIARHSVSFYI